MNCIAEQESVTLVTPSETIGCEEKKLPIAPEVYDEESRKLRNYLAEQEALRQLESRKSYALASAHRMPFIR
ncbi:MAG: hypothetical protein ACFFCP_18145 [Promethearchaeota archaeon]